jgi:hypothetical protein
MRLRCVQAGSARVDTLAVVAEDGVSLEDVRTQSALT